MEADQAAVLSAKKSLTGGFDAAPAATVDRSSFFPGEKAIGNFVMVVYCLAMRIRLEAGQRDLEKLRPGKSVELKVSLD